MDDTASMPILAATEVATPILPRVAVMQHRAMELLEAEDTAAPTLPQHLPLETPMEDLALTWEEDWEATKIRQKQERKA